MTEFESRMAELRARFVVRAADDRARLVIAIQDQDRAEIRRLAHGLSGTGGVFGFAALSDAAEAVEVGVDEGRDWADLRALCGLLLDALEAVQRL